MAAAEFLPQRPPFLLVDRLEFVDERQVRAALTVAPGTALLDGGGRLHEAALIEIVAQAWAAATGYRNTVMGRPMQSGLLVGIRRADITGTAAVGDRLAVTVSLDTALDDFLIVDGVVRRGDEELARASITLWSGDPLAEAP